MANSATYYRRCSVFSYRSITSDDINFQKRSIFIKNWLLQSARNDSEKMREILRDQPSVATEKDPYSGYTALHWAAKHGNTDMMRSLIRVYGVNVNEKTHGGYTALHLASKYCRKETCKVLVSDLGANINIRDNDGKKPNYYTIKQNDSIHRQQYVMTEKKTSYASKKNSQSSLQLPRFASLDA